MKKVAYIKKLTLCGIVFTLTLSGCLKQLDQLSESSITDQVFWKTTSDLIIGTNALYAGLPDFNTPSEDRYSDFAANVVSGPANFDRISDGSRVLPSNEVLWTDSYRFIRMANNVIEKAVNITGDQEVINNCVAQARFFRAFHYFKLVRAYGDVPYVNKTLQASDPELYGARKDRAAILDSIYADLDYAAANCPQADAISASSGVSGQPGKEYGRITRSAALAMKSRIALHEGTWHKFQQAPAFTGTPDPTRHLTLARDAAFTIMQEAKHQLFTGSGALSFQNAFRYEGETYSKSKENILTRIYGQNLANNVSSNSYLRTSLTDGANAATRKFVALALFSDGLPAGKSSLDSTGIETGILTEFRNRDPRMTQTIFKPGDDYVTIADANAKYGNTYYYHQQKYYTGSADFFQAAAGGVFIDFIVIRYAEVLLNYAEAVYELNDAITDAELDASINLLRNRATNNDVSKLSLLSNAFVGANNLNMREEIRRERSIELAYEGFRYWDLLRWKMAEIELPKAILQRKFFDNVNYGTVTAPALTPERYIIYQPAADRSFDPAKDYLWPLPTAQIGLSNGTLEQNPNW